MKFTKPLDNNGVKIPQAAIALSNLDQYNRVDMHAIDEAVVLLKPAMTADELIWSIHSLSELTEGLFETLMDACMRYGAEDEGEELPSTVVEEVSVPLHLLAAANIPQDAKLNIQVEPETQAIIIYAEDDDEEGYILEDLPEDMVDMLEAIGVDLDNLEELIESGEIIYGR